MRKLYFTTGSPFARAVRIVLVEKGLPFERDETYTTPSAEERAKVTPTLQVPTLVDSDVRLWDSTVILEYLMGSYPSPSATRIMLMARAAPCATSISSTGLKARSRARPMASSPA